jgi:hypothetical protein
MMNEEMDNIERPRKLEQNEVARVNEGKGEVEENNNAIVDEC